MGKKSGRKKEKQKPEYNLWRVLSEVFQGIFSLINSGRIYPAFAELTAA